MVPTPLLLERLCLLSFYYSIGRNTPLLSAPRGMVISYHDLAHEVFSEESKKEVWTSPPSPQNTLPSFEWPPTCVGSGSGSGRGWLLSHLSPETRESPEAVLSPWPSLYHWRQRAGKEPGIPRVLGALVQEIKGGWGLWVGICLLVSLNFCLTVIEKHQNQVWLCVGRHA